ncbi:MAG: ATP-binding protein [Clostridiaceae bacterium]|nr:ATP-binding protein [Clostridiaceae bacterium]
MRKKIQIYDRSIETAGICKDYKDAIAEFIWNSFDADATTVEIETKANQIGGLEYLEIRDNGKGICYETIDTTFGAFLVSSKGDNPKWSNIHGNEGKGRFSFTALAHEATWETVYEKDGSKIKYRITISSDNKDYMDITERENVHCDKTGTRLIFNQIYGINKHNLKSIDFKKSLSNVFAWFLYLNKDKDFKIVIDGERLDYSDIIDNEISEAIDIRIEEYEFTVHFIKWIGKIRERYYYYFIDSKHYEKYKQYTSFNKDSIEFPHSLYIISDYFDGFVPISGKIDKNQISIYSKTQKDSVFTNLIKELKNLVENKRKKFVKERAPEIIKQFNKEGAFPKFKNNRYDQERKRDLEEVVTEIYSVQPRIFQKCNLEQKKSIIGFLNLLLDTDERENIINIMEDIARLTPEEREDLNNVLKKTSLIRIIKTMKMIENRFVVIGILKKLVYELSNFTNERDHIQKAIEENYWLFGEQYNLVSADVNFEKALKEYLYVIDGNIDKEIYKINNQDRLRRPDIFICRSRSLEFQNTTQGEENIIVELKEPKVELNKKIYRQVEDYMDLIMNESKFNSGLRKWKFIMVSTTVDDFIKDLYKSQEDKGKPFLVRWDRRFEIYAMTWDDIFKSFEIRHRYLLDKLQFNKAIIEEELEAKGIELSREGSNILTEKLLDLQAN